MHFARPLVIAFSLFALALAAPANVGKRQCDIADADGPVGERRNPFNPTSIVF